MLGDVDSFVFAESLTGRRVRPRLQPAGKQVHVMGGCGLHPRGPGCRAGLELTTIIAPVIPGAGKRLSGGSGDSGEPGHRRVRQSPFVTLTGYSVTE